MHPLRLPLWLALLWFALPAALGAQPLPFGIALPLSLNFATAPNTVGSDARVVGKGTAFNGVADDATAASHNPGGLVQLERPEVSIVGSYFLRFERQDVTRSFIGGIAVRTDGHLVVTDAGRSAVLRVDPHTGDRTLVSDDRTGRGAVLSCPEGIAVEPNGHLVVVDRDLKAVVRVDPISGNRTLVSR